MRYLIDFQRTDVVSVFLHVHLVCIAIGFVVGTLQLLAWRRLSAEEQPFDDLAVDRFAFVWTQPVLLSDIPWEERRAAPTPRHYFQAAFIYLMPVFCELCLVGAAFGALSDVIKLVRKHFRRVVRELLGWPEEKL